MGFSKSTKEEAFVKCNRYCCICSKFCGTKIEAHHIKPRSENGPDTLDNCIPICLDCHEDVHRGSNPKGNIYTEAELRKLRDKAFQKHSVSQDEFKNHLIKFLENSFIPSLVGKTVEETLKRTAEQYAEKKSNESSGGFSIPKRSDVVCNVTVIGVGGAGNNAINRMIMAGMKDVDFIAIDTDAEVIKTSQSFYRIQIGSGITDNNKEVDPEKGIKAARASRNEIAAAIKNTDMLFIIAEMGGGTGTGAAFVIAEIAKEMDILTIAMVTKPFVFEGRKRLNNAEYGLYNLERSADSLIVVSSQKLSEYVPPGVTMTEAFKYAYDIFRQFIDALIGLILYPTVINIDFADICDVLQNKGIAYIGIGQGKGEGRVINAVRQAVASPFFDSSIEGAASILINVTGSIDISIDEVSEVGELVRAVVHPQAKIIFGVQIDPSLEDEVLVTIIATEFVN